MNVFWFFFTLYYSFFRGIAFNVRDAWLSFMYRLDLGYGNSWRFDGVFIGHSIIWAYSVQQAV